MGDEAIMSRFINFGLRAMAPDGFILVKTGLIC